MIIALALSLRTEHEGHGTEVELHGEVVDWLDRLTSDNWERAVIVIDRLAMVGPMARMPLSKALGDGLFELRFTLGPTARRITYRFTRDGRLVLLTTFRKQRNNERAEVLRAHREREACARPYP
jgi:phage-related protein